MSRSGNSQPTPRRATVEGGLSTPAAPWRLRRRAAGLARLGALWCCLASLHGPLPAAEPGLLVGRVSRVLDGDSLRLQQGPRTVEVRLAAVDAPELDQPHGRAARAGLQACAFGRIVQVRVTSQDHHGRAVGVLDAGGRDCGMVQLQQGLAWHAATYDRELVPAERLAYAQATREARRVRRGLWAEARPLPPWEHRRQSQAADRR